MGVPKFFRYMSERYPCLSEFVKEYQIPAFDNLYLDMNGIIHMCSHPDDNNVHFRITEERLFADIFHYIEYLFRMIKPQKVFFMAIDGVAPRAKMNQQRGRRFRSAKDAEKAEAEASKKGEKLPEQARFDSNCITPGTEFMARLHEQLKYFVVSKISNDKMWRRCKVILSGHETPGEGEHKIMDYIRYIRSQPGYDPNTRHCLYGLDADLIMLGLCTHDPHFSLLREEVKFGKKSTKRNNVPEEIHFFLLHLSLMREYLELEFSPLKEKLKGFEFDMEKLIDDWVLMGFLVGNDFIPHLPNMHIANGALPVLYKAYMDILPTLDGYINEGGTLNLKRFEKFMEKLGNIDLENFEEIRDDLLYMEVKTGRKQTAHRPVTCQNKENGKEDDDMDPALAALIKETEDLYLDTSSDEENGNDDDVAFKSYKDEYYRNKLEYHKVTKEVMRNQAEGYVRAIQWNLNYYYNGVCSWSWFYPHHYSPYISDIKGFVDLQLEFELGKPFKPYEQLLAVLPTASKQLLPECYHNLMTNEDSIIKEYYPEEFQTDLNGKKQEWEAVVLVPFIDEVKLLDAMKDCNEKLTETEIKRNQHGPMLIFTYTSDDLGKYEAPNYFPAVQSHALCNKLFFEDIRVEKDKLIKGAYPGAKYDVFYPGFPTMKHLKYTGELKKAKVKIFEQPSRNESMILKVLGEKDDSIPVDLLGKNVFIGWPHLLEAKVISISNSKTKYIFVDGHKKFNIEERTGNLISLFLSEIDGISEFYMNKMGIDFQEINVLVHVKVMIGRRYVFTANGRVTLEKQYAEMLKSYPLQGVISDIKVFDEHRSVFQEVTDVFPEDCECFVLTNPYYGSMGTVLDSKDSLVNERLKVRVNIEEEPDFCVAKSLYENFKKDYINLYNSACHLAISNYVFSRITGSIFITTNNNEGGLKSVNVGLDLKFNKRNLETPGYTKKIDGSWHYTGKAIDLVKNYIEKFPDIFKFLSKRNNADDLDANEVFGNEKAEEMVKSLQVWLKTLPTHNIERRVCNSLVLEPNVVEEIEKIVDDFVGKDIKPIVMQIKPQFLYKPEIQMGNVAPDPSANTQIFDRIVNIREGYTVSFGAKGTVIAVHKSSDILSSEDEIYDIVFDKKFTGGLALNCSDGRGYRLSKNSFINLSYGLRVMEEKTGKPGALLALAKANQTNNFWNSNRQMQKFPNSSAFVSFNNVPPRMPMPFNYQTPVQLPYMPPVPPQNSPFRQPPVYPIVRQQFPVNKPVVQKTFDFMPSYGVKNEPPKAAKTDNARNSVNTDFLKRILKIPDNSSQKQTIETKIFTSSNYQKDIAGSSNGNLTGQTPKINQTKSTAPATARLLSYYQSNALGCPRYNYFEGRPGGTVAQLTLPNRKVIVGKEGKSREEASENVALEALNQLLNVGKDEGRQPMDFPTPPQKWVQQPSNRNQQKYSPVKIARKTEQASTSNLNNFVPLQAIIKHSANKNLSKNDNTAKINNKSKTDTNNKGQNTSTNNNNVKNRQEPEHKDKINKRPRKTRIAANFVNNK